MEYVPLRNILYKLIDETTSVSKKMYVASCCNGYIYSESEGIQNSLLLLLLKICERYNDVVLYNYLKDFKENMVSFQIGPPCYKLMAICDRRLNMYKEKKCKCKNDQYKNLYAHPNAHADQKDIDDYYETHIKNSELPSEKEECIYVEASSIPEVNEFMLMLKLLKKYVYE